MVFQVSLYRAHPESPVGNQLLQSWVGGFWHDRNRLDIERKLSTCSTVGKARAASVYMDIPRYSTDWDGLRSDFSSFITMPRE